MIGAMRQITLGSDEGFPVLVTKEIRVGGIVVLMIS